MLAITSYYNPLRGPLRLSNYKTFRRHLGTPLLTVEWAQHGQFELGPQDAEHLIQVDSGDLLWQKERLLNIGIQKARGLGVDKVAMLDSDIVFANPNWHREVAQKLDSCSFIQCFDVADYLASWDYLALAHGQFADLPVERSTRALFGCVARGESLHHDGAEAYLNEPLIKLRGNPGLATANHLDKAKQCTHYEGNIVGGGDLAMLAGISRTTDEFFRIIQHTQKHEEHLRLWAQAQTREPLSIGHCAGRVMHLWHGHITDRQYRQRYSVLTQHGYDPFSDLDSATTELLRFSAANPALKQAVSQYIHSRKDA